MIDDDYYFAWPGSCDILAEINWSRPAPHDLLFSGGMQEDDSAYFYSLVSRVGKEWLPFYIGMTHTQSAAIRNKQPDHQRRLAKLKKENKGQIFSITLGTPNFLRGNITTLAQTCYWLLSLVARRLRWRVVAIINCD